MTIQEIKENLPDVKIKIAGKNYKAMVVGRNNPYATVTVKLKASCFASWQFSWVAIERAINNGDILIV